MLAFMRRSRAVFYALLVLLTAAVYGRACGFDLPLEQQAYAELMAALAASDRRR